MCESETADTSKYICKLKSNLNFIEKVQRTFDKLLQAVILMTTQFLYNAHNVVRPKTKIKVMNTDLCTRSSSAVDTTKRRTAVIIVLSARSHFDNRSLVRQTYGSIKSANNVTILAIVFMLGYFDEPGIPSVDTNNKLQAEINTFGDIIIGDFIDSYRNLTRKTIMAYEWISSHCRSADIVVKTDDDVVVNIFQLTKELNKWSPGDVLSSSNIWCRIHVGEETVNRTDSRFYASPVDFPTGTFPDHCGGFGYITTIRVIDRILDEISKSFVGRVCTHEDVFMTGIVPRHINSMTNETLNDPITLVSRWCEWYNLDLETGEGAFLSNLVKRNTTDIKVEEFDEFRSQFTETIFFLVSLTPEFREKYLRLWEIIKETSSV